MLYKKRCVREVFLVRVRYKVFGMIFEIGNTMKYHAFKSLYTYSIGSALQVKLSNIVITGILVSSWFGRLFSEVHLRS